MHHIASLAKKTTECFVNTRQVLAAPHPISIDLARQQACYVYVFAHPGRRVRAMYGSPLPRRPTLADEIISHTITAITHLGSSAVRRAELAQLTYAVAVLGPLQRISHTGLLDPKQYGLFVRSDQGRSAVILPQRTGIENAADQIATAMREALIDTRRDAVVMYRFPVVFYE